MTSTVQQAKDRTERAIATTDAFRLWLGSFPKKAVVGQKNRPEACPLANFLRDEITDLVVQEEQRGITRRFWVSDDYIEWIGKDASDEKTDGFHLFPPEWESLFVNLIDKRRTAWITVRQCLDVLDIVEALSERRAQSRADAPAENTPGV